MRRVPAIAIRLGAVALLCALVIGWIAWHAETRLQARKPSQVLLDRRGRYLGEIPGEQGALGYWPVPDDLPDKIVTATLETA